MSFQHAHLALEYVADPYRIGRVTEGISTGSANGSVRLTELPGWRVRKALTTFLPFVLIKG
jgi:hypothetical protein